MPVAEPTWTDRHLRAMGCSAQVIVLARPAFTAGLIDRAETFLASLEQDWSLFVEGSDLTRLNARAGRATHVSLHTRLLLAAAQIAWLETNGDFDPLAMPGRSTAGAMARLEIDWAAETAMTPSGFRFDPSGIAKGLAADLVAEDLFNAGALAVLINVGGDLRAIGAAGDPSADLLSPLALDRSRKIEAAWRVNVELASNSSIPLLVADGGVATSNSVSAHPNGSGMPHVLDPATGRFVDDLPASATVLAPEAWRAEAWTKVVLKNRRSGLQRAEDEGFAALLCDGSAIEVNAAMASYLDLSPQQGLATTRSGRP